jgi:hypothetical protein
MVELEVAAVHDGADGRPKRDPHRVRDRVSDAERHDAEGTDLQLVAGLHRV